MRWLACLLLACAVVRIAIAGDPVDFDTEVIPILTVSGCNAGACHGAAAGRGGFRLSLLGMDPAFDYEQIVRQWEGRRVNYAHPNESLLLRKPTEQLEHGGGTRFLSDSPESRLLERWIAQQAPRARLRQLEALEIEPSEVTIERPGDTFRLRFTARFSDGSVRDVSPLVLLSAEDPSALEVHSAQQITALRPGQHTLVARYLNQVRAVRVRMPLTSEGFNIADEPKFNYIDEHILATLADLRIPPSPQASDTQFARRVWLDLTGSLPAPESLQAFLNDPAHDRRQRLVDRLLESERFVDFWTLKLAQLFRVQSGTLQPEGARAFHAFLRESIAQDRSYASIVRAMLVATGDSYETGEANFLRAAAGPRELAEFFSESILGVRLRCANCHDHPLDRWTQDDYHGLAAIFARVSAKRIVEDAERGEVTHPRTGEPARPRLPGATAETAEVIDRERLAELVTDQQSPSLLARSMVNRIWRDLMGRGLVEPVDDLRVTNPPSHPELLDQLAEDFVAHQWSLRHIIRRIVSSAAYARSSQRRDANTVDDRFYSHAMGRPLLAEVISDCIADVTGIPETYPNVPAGTRAIALYDSRIPSPYLDVLGRCPRDGSMTAEEASAETLSRTLQLLNGPLLNGKLVCKGSRVRQWLSEGKQDAEILGALYVRALCRPPSTAEQTYWLEQSSMATSREAFWEDFLWALLNCREFRTNH